MQLIPEGSKSDTHEVTFPQFEQDFRLVAMHSIIKKYGCGNYEASVLFTKVLGLLKSQLKGQNKWKLIDLWKDFYKLADREMLHTSTSMSKNFGLTEATFNQLVSELEQGKDTLFEQVFLTHFEDCVKYLMNTYKASPEDAYDASMNTMLEFCRRLKAGRIAYGNLRFLFTRMAGQVYLKWAKKQNKQTDLDNFDIADVTEDIDEESYAILNKAWNALQEECKSLLEAFYYDGTTLENIALAMDKSAVAVRKQKQRCVEKLRSLYIQFSSPGS